MQKTNIKKSLNLIEETLLPSETDYLSMRKYPNFKTLNTSLKNNPNIDYDKEFSIDIIPNNDSYIAKIYQK